MSIIACDLKEFMNVFKSQDFNKIIENAVTKLSNKIMGMLFDRLKSWKMKTYDWISNIGSENINKNEESEDTIFVQNNSKIMLKFKGYYPACISYQYGLPT